MEDLVITYHHDPAHGWLEVKRELVGDRVFLEEDADASLLIRSLGELNIRYTTIDRHTNADHWIRVLDRYNALD
jgi:hypothetical protein